MPQYQLVERSAIGGALPAHRDSSRLGLRLGLGLGLGLGAGLELGLGLGLARLVTPPLPYPPPPPPTHLTILAPTLLTNALFSKGLSGTLSSAAHHPLTHPGQTLTFFYRRRPTQSRPCLSAP